MIVMPRSALALVTDDRFPGPWLTADEARQYTRRPTMAAWYDWRRRHGIVPNRSGLIAKRDLDHALAEPKPPRQMAPASLTNLPRVRMARATAKGSDDAENL